MSTEPESTLELEESPQLDKVIESLFMLINMQADRDKKMETAFENLNGQFESLSGLIENLQPHSPALANSSKPTLSEVDGDQSESQASKMSILAEYGLIDDEQATSQDNCCNQDDSENSCVEPQTATTSMSEVDAEEIESIKAELREKLRTAELELATKRAELDQRQVNLEEREAQVNRLQQKLTVKVTTDEGEAIEESSSILSRLKSHLDRIHANSR